MEMKEAKQRCWNKLLEINANSKIKNDPNGSSYNIKKMIKDYNYANYLAAFVLKENDWKLKLNPDEKAIDLLGEDPLNNKVAVEIKTEFYPSDNFFLEINDKGKVKDYWVKAKTEQVYYGAICGKTKTLHIYDLSALANNNLFHPIHTKYNTIGYLINRQQSFSFKVGVFDLGI